MNSNHLYNSIILIYCTIIIAINSHASYLIAEEFNNQSHGNVLRGTEASSITTFDIDVLKDAIMFHPSMSILQDQFNLDLNSNGEFVWKTHVDIKSELEIDLFNIKNIQIGNTFNEYNPCIKTGKLNFRFTYKDRNFDAALYCKLVWQEQPSQEKSECTLL